MSDSVASGLYVALPLNEEATMDIREAVWSLPPNSRVALARDILYDVLRNEGSAGGWSREELRAAWGCLEKRPEVFDDLA